MSRAVTIRRATPGLEFRNRYRPIRLQNNRVCSETAAIVYSGDFGQ